MNTDHIAVTLVIDRSGSMHGIASDVVGSVKQFIHDQKQNVGKTSFTAVQFDNHYEVIYDYKDIHEVDSEQFAKEYSPRGSTALLDAIGRATLSMNAKLESIPESERPKKVIVAVITDGLENASREFDLPKIKEMIQQKEAAGWNYLFLGATLDTMEIAEQMGFCSGKATVYDVDNFDKGIQLIGKQLEQVRQGQEANITQNDRDILVKKTVKV